MTPCKGINPENAQQARAFFHSMNAFDVGERRHPRIAMQELAQTLGFKLLAEVPQSMHDGWDFWIEFAGPAPDLGPCFLDYVWKPVGQA